MLIEKLLHKTLSPTFRFVVLMDNRPFGAFTEISLPTIEWEMEVLKEGGENTFVRQLPGQRKPSSLTLKNGIGIVSEIMRWYHKSMSEKYVRRNVTILMLDSLLAPVMVWHVEDTLPTRWTMSQLQSDSNTLAIQTLELACGEITIGPNL